MSEIKIDFHNSEFAILVKWSFVEFVSKVIRKLTPMPNNFALKFFHANFERTIITQLYLSTIFYNVFSTHSYAFHISEIFLPST